MPARGIARATPRSYCQPMILLRHGQSEFNLHFSATRIDPGIVDPKLTPLGHQQADAAAEALRHEGIARIIASPYTRALQTAAVARALDLPVLVHPVVRERYKFACDIGSPRIELERDWPSHNFSGIEEIWWPAIEEQAASIIDRARLFRAEMSALHDWSDTLVVSHWGFILAMTGISVQNGQWLRYDPTQPAPAEIIWKA
jgi:broad specificity phosphatase PhoE